MIPNLRKINKRAENRNRQGIHPKKIFFLSYQNFFSYQNGRGKKDAYC